jgi:DNA-directed RNA polymerase specialized sigma24 family protein
MDRERRRRFDRVVSVYYQDLYRYAAWLSRDPGVAEVVVQETLLRAWKSLDSLRDDEAAKHWLLTIVRRENARYFEGAKIETFDHSAGGQRQRCHHRRARRTTERNRRNRTTDGRISDVADLG